MRSGCGQGPISSALRSTESAPASHSWRRSSSALTNGRVERVMKINQMASWPNRHCRISADIPKEIIKNCGLFWCRPLISAPIWTPRRMKNTRASPSLDKAPGRIIANIPTNEANRPIFHNRNNPESRNLVLISDIPNNREARLTPVAPRRWLTGCCNRTIAARKNARSHSANCIGITSALTTRVSKSVANASAHSHGANIDTPARLGELRRSANIANPAHTEPTPRRR